MPRDEALLNAIAGFLDRDALGAPAWSTPQEGARRLLRLLLPIIDDQAASDASRLQG